jgi:hypothetical protein
MTSGLKTIIYPVKDLAQAKTRYGALRGATPSADEPSSVGFSTAEQEVGSTLTATPRG